ncbi:MAG: FGGY-family carbohydrate kinase [Candidatus Sulfotelmatobacter sp.]
MSLLAIDIGSSRCKAVAFALTGQILAQDSCAYTPEFPAPSHAEINPEFFWQAVCRCSQAVSKSLSDPVRALCLSSHGETFVPVNESNEAIAPAILNQDNRATEETAWLEKTLGKKHLFEITGLVAHPMYPVPKILWLREHRPDILAPSVRFITVIGYVLSRLGLPAYVDYSLASRYLAFDIRQRRWSEEILAATEINAECLPIPAPAGTIAGKLDGATASQLGLSAGTMVVLGGHDQPCGALGVGAIGSGRVADSMGTYECLLAASDQPTLTAAALAASLNSYCHVVPDKFVTLAYFPSGIMLKWFHDLLYAEGHGEAHRELRGDGVTQPGDSSCAETVHYATLEREAPAGPTGLCITPNLIGTCNPDFNPHERGVISGLTANTMRSQIYKGILEGIACEMSRMTDILTSAVGEFRDIYVTGGGSRSALGLELRAALSGRQLHVMECPEAVCLGGAILAGVASGEYGSLREAVELVVRDVSVVSPDHAIAAAYAQQAKKYGRLRSALTAITGAESSRDPQEGR